MNDNDDQNQQQIDPLDPSLEVELNEDESQEKAAMAGAAGVERQPSLETQKSVDSQTNSELPPFIQETLSHAKDGRQQAQQIKNEDVSEAVKIEEQVLGELKQLTKLAPSEHAAQVAPQEEQIEESVPSAKIGGQELAGNQTSETNQVVQQAPIAPQSSEAPAGIVRMSDNLRPEVQEVKHTPEVNAPAPEKPKSPERPADTGREATVSLLSAVIEKLEADREGMDKLAVQDSEEALFRMIQKDALNMILERVREGEWNSTRSMESLAMKMGIFSIIGLFRELKAKTTNEATQQRIQQAIDYMLNENDKLDLEEAQAQSAADAVQDDNYADPQTQTPAQPVTQPPPQQVQQTPVAPNPQIAQQMQVQNDIDSIVTDAVKQARQDTGSA